MKPIKIYLADWIFIEKKTGEDVLVEEIITPYIPLKFLILDDYMVSRAIKAFGENRKTFLRTLEKNEDGSFKVKSVIYRKYLSESNVNYEIINGMINFKLSEPAKEMLITGLIDVGATEEEAAVFAGQMVEQAEKGWMQQQEEANKYAFLKGISYTSEKEGKGIIDQIITPPPTPEWDKEF